MSDILEIEGFISTLQSCQQLSELQIKVLCDKVCSLFPRLLSSPESMLVLWWSIRFLPYHSWTSRTEIDDFFPFQSRHFIGEGDSHGGIQCSGRQESGRRMR